jgi:hypothetical protein
MRRSFSFTCNRVDGYPYVEWVEASRFPPLSINYGPGFAPIRANALLLTKAERKTMSVREVTYKELLAILRTPPPSKKR